MGRKVLKIENYSSEEIMSLINKKDDFKIGVRLFAIHQVSLGMSSRKLEEFYHTSFKQITNWVHRFDKEGIDGLKDKPGRGRKSNLSSEQRERLSTLLCDESPMTYGYNTETWTGPLLIEWITNHFNIVYKKAQIYNIIKSLGFTFQKSRGIYPEADIEAQQKFKEDLKKTFGESS